MCYQPKYYVSTKCGDITDGFLTEKEAQEAREEIIQDDIIFCIANGTKINLVKAYEIISSLYKVSVR